eukprot:gene11560-13660_t
MDEGLPPSGRTRGADVQAAPLTATAVTSFNSIKLCLEAVHDPASVTLSVLPPSQVRLELLDGATCIQEHRLEVPGLGSSYHTFHFLRENHEYLCRATKIIEAPRGLGEAHGACPASDADGTQCTPGSYDSDAVTTTPVETGDIDRSKRRRQSNEMTAQASGSDGEPGKCEGGLEGGASPAVLCLRVHTRRCMLPEEIATNLVLPRDEVGDWLLGSSGDFMFTWCPSDEPMDSEFFGRVMARAVFPLPEASSQLVPLISPVKRYCLDLRAEAGGQALWGKSKLLRRYGRHFRLSLNGDFRRTLARVAAHHIATRGSTWLTSDLMRLFVAQHNDPECLVQHTCFELWAGDELAAAIVGFQGIPPTRDVYSLN